MGEGAPFPVKAMFSNAQTQRALAREEPGTPSSCAAGGAPRTAKKLALPGDFPTEAAAQRPVCRDRRAGVAGRNRAQPH